MICKCYNLWSVMTYEIVIDIYIWWMYEMDVTTENDDDTWLKVSNV